MSLVLNPAGIAENEGVSTIGARLSAPAAVDTTLNVEVTADAPAAASDFMLSANRMLTITAGATDSTGIVTVTAVDNLVHRTRQDAAGGGDRRRRAWDSGAGGADSCDR